MNRLITQYLPEFRQAVRLMAHYPMAQGVPAHAVVEYLRAETMVAGRMRSLGDGIVTGPASRHADTTVRLTAMILFAALRADGVEGFPLDGESIAVLLACVAQVVAGAAHERPEFEVGPDGRLRRRGRVIRSSMEIPELTHLIHRQEAAERQATRPGGVSMRRRIGRRTRR
jgi:hypothetical protein